MLPTRSRRLVIGLVAALLLPLSGCLGSTDNPGFQLNFGWQVSPLPSPAPGEEVPFTVITGMRSVTVEGTFILPCTPGRWRPGVNVGSTTIEMLIEYDQNQTCNDIGGRIVYTAVLLNVPEGDYRLTVRHVNDEHVANNTIVVDQQVTIAAFTP